MRHAIFALAFFIAAAASAQQQQPQQAPAQPDYSREHLLQVYARTPVPEQPRAKVDVGMVDVNALGIRWHLGYLPFFAPLPGSTAGTTRVWPTAFALLHVDLPGGPPVIERSRAVTRELRRIDRVTRTRTDVVVRTE